MALPYLSFSFLLILTVSLSCIAETVSLRRGHNLQDQTLTLRNGRRTIPNEQFRILPPLSGSNQIPDRETTDDSLNLLDICLVVSVDGKFHGLNRTSGQLLWSMPSSTVSDSMPSVLSPLIRTQHPDNFILHDDDDDDDEASLERELYIVEPQSGDIYVLPSASSNSPPLQRLAFSLPQLVDMSPFSFSGDDRVFVGKKETSLLSIELETGQLKRIVNSECPWDPLADFDSSESNDDFSVDLDELDGTKPFRRAKAPASTQILIGRTDYSLSIRTHSPRSRSKPTIQNLHFSTYGPNNEDHILQASYHRSLDDMYIHSLPNGEILAFRTDLDGKGLNSRPIWGHSFGQAIVAAFDVVRSPSREAPLVLLQPRSRIQDVLPAFELPSIDSTYVGIVKDNGALFAMSPSMYPLVVFHNEDGSGARSSFPHADEFENDETNGKDLTPWRKMSKYDCDNSAKWTLECLVGVRPVEDSGRSRFNRLLDGVPPLTIGARQQRQNSAATFSDLDETDSILSRPPHPALSIDGPAVKVPNQLELDRRWTFSGIAAALIACLLGLIYVSRRQSSSLVSSLTKESVSNVPTIDLNVSQINSATTLFPAVEMVEEDRKVSDPSSPLSSDFSTPQTTPVKSPHTSSFPPSLKSPPAIPLPSSSTSLIFNGSPLKRINSIAEDSQPLDEEADESEREGDAPGENGAVANGRRRATRRRKRGKKNKGNGNANNNNNNIVGEDVTDGAEKDNVVQTVEDKREKEWEVVESPTPLPTPGPVVTEVSQSSSLIVSDEVLGFGSHGTVVFKGDLQGRAVAVKRLLRSFVTLAQREVALLTESDSHPNVIRYYYQESHSDFLYIALELCPASLADVIERPDLHRSISDYFDPRKALVQITRGLRHLHELKIIHRDIKPQNILIASPKRGKDPGSYRMLISDFGLCKKLEFDQTSFLPSVGGPLGAGTVGWRAPEILRKEVKLDEEDIIASDDQSQSSRGSAVTVSGLQPAGTRLTKSVDVFALGCLYYYTMTNGGHPYGDRFERESNILKDAKTLSGLDSFGEEGLEAVDLIEKMLDPDASKRPNTTHCLTHPFFWSPHQRLSFLQDASDRFEIMCRDPRESDLIRLEKNAFNVVGSDWHHRLDKIFIDNLGKFRKYDGKSVQDLLRALRNKKHHYQDLPDNVKRHLGPLPDGFLNYFTRRFPHLIMHVHSVITDSTLRFESMFHTYFELADQ